MVVKWCLFLLQLAIRSVRRVRRNVTQRKIMPYLNTALNVRYTTRNERLTGSIRTVGRRSGITIRRQNVNGADIPCRIINIRNAILVAATTVRNRINAR